MEQKIVLVQVAGLGYDFLKQHAGGDTFLDLPLVPLQGLFPALTCSVQATMRTATVPSAHGMVGDGFFFRELGRPLFGEQSSALVHGPRIWEHLREDGKKAALLFIQQSFGRDADIILSPAPIRRHHGGMIVDCFSQPPELNERLKRDYGVFPLENYRGPRSSIVSSEWIKNAVVSVMEQEKPELLFAHLPHLDYALQREGPASADARRALHELAPLLGQIVAAAKSEHYRVVIFGDYVIGPAETVEFPNRILFDEGLFKVRHVRGMRYPDFFTSAAFAVADHQIAHVYVFDPSKKEKVKALLGGLAGVERVLDGIEKLEAGIDHAHSGDLVLVARPGAWFDYRWWRRRKEAPDYAAHIDIRSKPGSDPTELFSGLLPASVSRDPARIRGTHGRLDDDAPVALVSDLPFDTLPKDLLALSRAVREWIEHVR